MNYKQLSQKERDEIYDLLQQGEKKAGIARLLGRDPTTIGREIKRNASSIERRFNNSPKKKKHYLPDRAQGKYEERRRTAKSPYPLKNPFIYTYTHEHLKIGWSPEMISGRIKDDHKQAISAECIYQYIYGKHAKDKGFKLWEYLVRSHKKRRKKHGRKSKRTLIPNRIGIEQRPLIVEKRKRIGDWEGDTIFGIGKGSALGTFNERKCRRFLMRKLPRKTAEEMKKAAVKIFETIPKEFRKTMTLDNGSENTKHEEISSETGLKIYFANPYHSWERGSNEKANGMVRRYFPKKTNFDNISEEEIQLVEDKINNWPMKCLKWKTPNEVYQKSLNQLLSTRSKLIALEN
ncbi:MAG: IS30 family transposase [Actinomycetota bacterium]